MITINILRCKVSDGAILAVILVRIGAFQNESISLEENFTWEDDLSKLIGSHSCVNVYLSLCQTSRADLSLATRSVLGLGFIRPVFEFNCTLYSNRYLFGSQICAFEFFVLANLNFFAKLFGLEALTVTYTSYEPIIQAN